MNYAGRPNLIIQSLKVEEEGREVDRGGTT